MNDELQGKLAEILGSLSTQVQQATDASVDFAKEQLPLVAKEIVAWAIWSNAIAASLCLVGAVACGLLCFLAWRLAERAYKKDSNSEEDFFWGMAGLAAAIVGVFLLIFSAARVSGIVKPIVAPRVYLIEWCAERLK